MLIVAPAGRVLRINAAARRLLSRDDDTKTTLDDLVPEDSRTLMREFVEKAFEGRMMDHELIPMLAADGGVHLVRAESALIQEEGDTVVLLELASTDGVERGDAGLELLRYAVEAANDAIIITTPELEKPHPLIEYVNPAFSRMTGWQAFEVIGKSPRILQGPLTDRNLLDRIKRDLREKSYFLGETVNYRKDGSTYWVEWRVTALRGSEGSVTHWVAIQRDVSDRRQREDEIRSLNENLEMRVSERTKELEDLNRELQSFSYTVSHDLRSPLRSLLGFSRALQEDYEDKLDDEARDYLTRMAGAARRMDELISAILGLSRLSRVELNVTDVDVSKLAGNVASDLGTAFPTVRFEIAEGLRTRADEGLLRVALHNLFENAAKFSAEAPDPLVRLESTVRDRRRFLVVRDNGMGFDQAKAQSIFQPFERLYAGVGIQGTGIGLATVDRLVKRHGGRIFAESEPGKGASFYFTLEPV